MSNQPDNALREKIFWQGEITYKPFTMDTPEPEEVVKIGLDDLMKIIQAHTDSILRELLEQMSKGTHHCEDLSVAWCTDCLKEWHDRVTQSIREKLSKQEEKNDG